MKGSDLFSSNVLNPIIIRLIFHEYLNENNKTNIRFVRRELWPLVANKPVLIYFFLFKYPRKAV